MANTESSKINALVFQHLSKVAPDIAQTFKRTHPCDESEICASLPQIVSHYKTVTLANSLVYKYVNQNYPQLSPHFKLEYVACDFTLEDVVDSYNTNQDVVDSYNTNQDVGDSYDTNQDVGYSYDTNQDVGDSYDTNQDVEDDYENSHTTTTGKRKRDESGSRRGKHKTDTVDVLPEQDTIDSQFLSELEKYYSCTFSSESSSDSEDGNNDILSNLKSQTKPWRNTSKQVSNKKSFQNIEKDDIVGFCGILDCDVYKHLLGKVAEQDKALDILASFILKENILVRKIHQLVKTSGYGKLSRDLPKFVGITRTTDVKVGHYSPGENTLIESNWKKLVTKCELDDPLQAFEDISGSKKSNEDALKQNVIGLYLSLGMTKVRYASDVFRQARRIFFQRRKKNQHLTPQEQLVMMEYVEKHGENCDWRELGYILFKNYERHHSDIMRWYYNVKNKGKVGQFGLIEDKLIIDTIISDNEANIGDPNFMESVESFETLEKLLGRRKELIRDHWHSILKPLLLRYHAGTLNLDIKRMFFNYLNEKKVSYLQDIEWSELLQQPVFSGQTRRSLTALFNTTQRNLSRSKKCGCFEITVPIITEYVNERQNPQNMNNNTILNGKKEKRQTEIINYYKTVMNKITN